MALACTTTTSPGGVRILCSSNSPNTSLPVFRHVILPKRISHTHIVFAKKLRTGRFDSKNKKSGVSTKDQEEEDEEEIESTAQIKIDENTGTARIVLDDGFVVPELPGLRKDFWEGPQWDAFGFFVEYMWAFGIGFALIACGLAVSSYNEGATDFKKTPAYQESIQSQDLLEEPEGSNSDVFESNPTEEAPSLE